MNLHLKIYRDYDLEILIHSFVPKEKEMIQKVKEKFMFLLYQHQILKDKQQLMSFHYHSIESL